MPELQIMDVESAKRAGIDWPDVYFCPAYGHAVEMSDEGTWRVATYGDDVVYPYLERSIDASLGPAADGAFDIASPYGYAGTHVADGTSPSTVEEFRRQLRRTLRDRGVVAEFQRVSGLVPGREPLERADPELVMERRGSTVLLDLSAGYEAAWAASEGRSRTAIRKARRLGYSATFRSTTSADLCPGGPFRDLYDATMKRVGAQPYYFFSDAYYVRLLGGLGTRLWTVEVRDAGGGVGAAGIIMQWPPFLHLHLVGSDPSATRDGAGNLLYDAVIARGAERDDFRRFHLGGGISKNRGLILFKRSFGGEAIPFYLARSVLEPSRYRELTQARARQIGCAVSELEATCYFPAYRATPL
jgi:hypothetical protein